MDRRTALALLGAAPAAFVATSMPGRRLRAEQSPAAAFVPDAEIRLTAAPATVPLLPGEPTQVWRYTGEILRGPASLLQPIEGSYLGPVIRAVKGQRLRIRFRNELGEPSIVHWHGLDVPERADGHPRLAVPHGGEYVYDFEVTNRAGTYWYHPHPHMRTAAQVYQGLAGLFLVTDPEEETLKLPSGEAELLCVVQDRRFDARNQFLYSGGSAGSPAQQEAARGMGRGRGMERGGMMGGGMGQMMELMNGWLGARMLVSGRVQPQMDVERRSYRVRLLNGSNARIYKLAWSDGTPFDVIGSDGGLLDSPKAMNRITLAPGQRIDAIVDLSQHAPGATVQLQSLTFPAADAGRVGMMGDTSPVPQGAPLVLMTLRTTEKQGPRYLVPARLLPRRLPRTEDPAAAVRKVPLTFMRMNWMIDGRVFDLADVAPSETVTAGSTHIWEFVNEPNPMGMQMAHPVHIHGRQFRVLGRFGGPPNALRESINDEGWTDTVLVLPGETVRVQVTFSEFPGLYLYHCHILEHEDMGMMRNLRIVPKA